MKTDFSNDLVVGLNDMIINITTHKNFGKEELEDSIDKLFYLRNIRKDENKIIQLNITENVDLSIKKSVKTKCFLTTQDGEILTHSLELDIFSINEANNSTLEGDKLIEMLKCMGEIKYDNDDVHTNLKSWIENFLKSKEFKMVLDDDVDE